MKKILLILLALTVQAQAAEFLVTLKKDRGEVGGIVAVRPDGHQWGKKECYPDFVVIKVPTLTYKDAQKYEGALWDITVSTAPVLKNKYRYWVTKTPALLEYVNTNQLSAYTTTNTIMVQTILDKLYE